MSKYLLLTLTLLAMTRSAESAQYITGELKSDYYVYQDATGQDRFNFTQTARGVFAPQSWKGWKVNFLGELRDGNPPLAGSGDSRLLGLSLNGRFGRHTLAVGRIASRGGMVDGAELSGGHHSHKVTLSGGREFYPIYRGQSSDLPERYNASAIVEGKVMGALNWQVDHVSRFLTGEIDDQTTGLALRGRYHRFIGWDVRLNYDSKSSDFREAAIGFRLQPHHDLRLDLRYSERRIRIPQSSFLSRYELEPTKLAKVLARYRICEGEYWVGLGFAHRMRDEGDLERVTASFSTEHTELGVRYQTGTDMGNFGGYVEASHRIMDHLTGSVSFDFDRWDSSWDAEPVDAWANSATLSYELSPVATAEGRVEHYRDEFVDSDVRGLITFKLRFGI